MPNDSYKKSIKGRLLILVLSMLSIFMITGCEEEDSDETELIGNWIEFSDFEGVPRSDAVAFSIGGKGYIGTGYDGSDRLNDFWEFDPKINSWTKKADFPGAPRNGAVGFATDTKGYIGTGYDGSNKLNDFYEYDPATDSWTQIPDFGGSARYGAVAFSLNNKGYVSTGYDGNSLKDLWEYDPVAQEWTKKLSLGGGKRRDAVAFTIDSKAYICTGVDNSTYENDLWEYDPASDTWARKRYITDISSDSYDDDYSGMTGTNKVAFTMNGKGYLATGGQSTTGITVWEYDPVNDLWVERTSLEASARMEAVGFTIEDMGFILTGRSGSYYLDDIWGFEPDKEQVDYDTFNAIVN
ncbi:MAG: hypothetical protein JXR46_11600 [Calditrichaceae bacterium]|nr:hypothetical protein [Calditrichaceae bacterium]MBN2709680.1 hypothetical protein [Calditrichaceae bacterium]RQV95038.1 MAG: galactose oxidase [Calditrichota bacterium]